MSNQPDLENVINQINALLELASSRDSNLTRISESFSKSFPLVPESTLRVIKQLIANNEGRYHDASPSVVSEQFADWTEYRDSLVASNEFAQGILQNSPMSIIVTDLNGMVTEFNHHAEKLTGYTREEMVGINSPAIFHIIDEVIEASKELSAELGIEIPPGLDTFVYKVRMGGVGQRQWTCVRKDGSRARVDLTVSGLYDKDSKLCGYISTGVDVTQFVETRLQLENERAKSMHNAKLASLGEMAAGIAHEINNPLAVLVGGLPLLYKHREDPVKFGDRITSFEKAAHRIEKIVKGLRKFSRTTGGSEFKNEDIATLVSESMVLTEAKAKRYAVKISVDVPEGLSIYCNGVEIEQVLVNLINNGVDAIREKDGEPWLKISAFKEEETLIVRVIDSGNGIPVDIEMKLFQPFFTTKPVGEGTGLGLSITKGILDSHKAKFFLNREFPNTCFEIQFPVAAEN